jgi:hypothetical protein
MKKLLMASVLTGAMSLPAFAQMSHDMSCADFMAMDADAQMKTLGQMAGDAMGADNMAAGSMAADNMAADDMAADNMAADNIGAADSMKAEDTVTPEAVAAVCGDNPEMMVGDAMMQAAGGN